MDVAGRSEAAQGDQSIGACLNCGAQLTGPFCRACGQQARIRQSLAEFFGDIIAGLINFEGKFWRTLPMLTLWPGELTRRYVEGQRVRFISPVALYLFTVFLMFAVLSFNDTSGVVAISGNIDTAIQNERQALRKLETELQQARVRRASVTAIQRNIIRKRDDIRQLEILREGDFANTGQRNPAWLRDAVKRVAADPHAAMLSVQEAASRYSWLLIPLSVPFLRLLFPLSRRQLFKHTVFVTYSLAFMMLLVVFSGILAMIGAGGFIPWLALVPPIHMYRQMRAAYGLSVGGALVRTALLIVASLNVLVLWMMSIIALGLLG